jgi:MFS family permease
MSQPEKIGGDCTMSTDDATRRSDTDSPAPGASMWSPLRRPVFRSVWIAWVVASTGTWMQIAGAAWLMTSLTPSPLLVALMQTATSLPVFLVGLPAGALADLVDRRKLLLTTQAGILLAALTLGVLTLVGLVSAWTLLAFTFLLGLGAALTGPAWQALLPELVEREELQSAVALNAGGFHAAQAVGPALGGLVVAAAGPAAAFLLNAASLLGMLRAIARWRPTRAASEAPPEDMLGASVAGLRYVRDAPALQAVLVRIGAFSWAPAPCGPCCPSLPGASWASRQPAMGSCWAASVLAPCVACCFYRACGGRSRWTA